MTDAILYAYLDPGPVDADAFYTWYEDVIVPGRLEVPGFRRARRFRSRERSSAGLMLYDVDDLEVFSSSAYRQVQQDTAEVTRERMGGLERFDRATASLVLSQGTIGDARHLFVLGFSLPDDAKDELDHWYEQEHGPMLLRASGWDGFRVFDVEDSNTDLGRLAVHELTDLAALDSPERAEAGATPWRDRLAGQSWFSSSQRTLYDAVATFRPSAATPT